MAEIKKEPSSIFYAFALPIIAATLLVFIQPSVGVFRAVSDHAVEVLLGILAFGLIAMLLAWQRLMFVSFAAVGALCLLLKSSSNPEPTYAPPKVKEDIDILHLNISDYDQGKGYDELTSMLLESGADLVSIQEVTPDWDSIFRIRLLDTFPHFSSIASIGFNGMAVFSVSPLEQLDTFYHKGIPNLTGLFVSEKADGEPIRFISTYTNPIFNTDSFYEDLREHFQVIIDKLEGCRHPKLAFGNYNTVAWSSEMKHFTNALDLRNSRRSLNPFSEATYQHIFHSMDMECVDFDGFYDTLDTKIGLVAKFHLRDEPPAPPRLPDPEATQ